MEAIHQYFPMVVFIIFCKVVTILKCDHSNESKLFRCIFLCLGASNFCEHLNGSPLGFLVLNMGTSLANGLNEVTRVF